MVYRLRSAALVGLAALFWLALRPVSIASAQGSPTNDILQLVNQVRAEYGLPALSYNAALASAAQGHANFIAQNAIYSHIGVNGSTWQDRAEAAGYPGYAGENLVGGTRLTPQQGVTWWRNSAIHFTNMLNPRWTEAGVGFAVGNNQNFYVLVMGTPNDAPPPREERQVVDVPFIVAPIELALPGPDGSIVHVVKEGHTLWAIAARYEVSLADLYLFNALTEDSVINPGDRLTIRLADGQPPPPTPTPPVTHIVKEGESLWTIAANYRLDLATLLWYNAMSIDSVVHPGNEIKIRLLPDEAPPPTPTPQLVHVVKSGDTAWGIALLHGLSLDQLMALNNMQPDALLQIGQQLFVRPTDTPTPPPPTPTPVPVTPQPTASLTPTLTPSPEPTAVALLVATPTPAPDEPAVDWQRAVGIGAVVVGLGLTALAGVAVLAVRRESG